MSKTTNKFSPEVRARAVRMILDHEGDYPSRWSAAVSVADKIGCALQTLHEWVKKVRGRQRQACWRANRYGRQAEGAGTRGPRAAAGQRDFS